ncbi:MAG: acetate/propionate family kinase [Pirellulaceae bacterium]
MKVLVANLGSTSFKYRLYDMPSETQLARGGVERIGAPMSRCFVEIGSKRSEMELPIPHHGEAVRACVGQLTDPVSGCLKDASELSAIGFKAVHGGRLQGVFRIDQEVLAAMEEVNSVAPAHNPPYLAAMRQLAKTVPEIPLVAALETDFHQTIPEANRHYAIPHQWRDALPIRKWGFHGASHRYIGWRMETILGKKDAKVVSCHLGGSSSLCALRDGKSQATTMGMSPQSGLPQNNRVGDFDPFALPLLLRHTGLPLEKVLDQLANQGGLLGLSRGLSGDIRDLEQAAAQGNQDAQLALDVYVAEIRRHLGGMVFLLGGTDAIVFTGGIGENGVGIREAVCRDLESIGIRLDAAANLNSASGRDAERRIDDGKGSIQLWIVPTNEERIVARQTVEALT